MSLQRQHRLEIMRKNLSAKKLHEAKENIESIPSFQIYTIIKSQNEVSLNDILQFLKRPYMHKVGPVDVEFLKNRIEQMEGISSYEVDGVRKYRLKEGFEFEPKKKIEEVPETETQEAPIQEIVTRPEIDFDSLKSTTWTTVSNTQKILYRALDEEKVIYKIEVLQIQMTHIANI